MGGWGGKKKFASQPPKSGCLNSRKEGGAGRFQEKGRVLHVANAKTTPATEVKTKNHTFAGLNKPAEVFQTLDQLDPNFFGRFDQVRGAGEGGHRGRREGLFVNKSPPSRLA